MSGAKLCVSINQSLTPNIPSSVLLESMVTVMEREREKRNEKLFIRSGTFRSTNGDEKAYLKKRYMGLGLGKVEHVICDQ
jgi:hypothetical protein